MSQNIALLYMSAYFPRPADHPGEKRFLRAQTNEGALCALQEKKSSRPDKIIALCSATVRETATVPSRDKPDEKITTLQYFREEFLPQQGIPKEKLEVIAVPDSMGEPDQTKAISAILGYVHEGDRLYIDLSGGMRDTAMLMVAVARYLKDIRHVQTQRVIYSELQGNHSAVKDSNRLYDLFDLISAVDEFFSTGTAQKLQIYLRLNEAGDPDLHELLNCINRFADDLALCRVQTLKADLKALAKCLKKSSPSDSTLNGLLYQLMNDRFKNEFAELLENRTDSLPALVQWCTGHRMYQQALTLLSEEMPEYLCSHVFLQPTQKGLDFMANQPQNAGRSWVSPLFRFHFCRLALLQEVRPYTADLRLTRDKNDAEGNALFRVATEEEIRDYLEQAVEQDELMLEAAHLDLLAQGVQNYQKIQQYRNQINHANDSAIGYQCAGLLPLDTASIECVLLETADYLRQLKPSSPAAPAGTARLPLDQKF